MVRIRALIVSTIAFAIASQLTVDRDALARPLNIGTVSEVKSAAFGTPAGGTQAPKRLDDGVELNEFIETVPDGALEIALIDQTNLSMGGGSKMLLDELVFDPKTRDGSSAIKFAAGTFYWVTGKIATKDRIAIDTPTATIGIRGTEFSLKIGADGATRVAVVEGLVELVSKTTGEILSIPAGHNGDVDAAGRTSALRVGIPATGDRTIDAVVGKAEEKAIRANLAKAQNEKGLAAAQNGQELKASQSQRAGQILPIKAGLLNVTVANGNGPGGGSGLKLDRTRPITITAPTMQAGSRVAPRGRRDADTPSKSDRDNRAAPQGDGVEQVAANPRVAVGGVNGGGSSVGGNGGISNSGGGALAGSGGGNVASSGGSTLASVGGGSMGTAGSTSSSLGGSVRSAGSLGIIGAAGGITASTSGGTSQLGASRVGGIGTGSIGSVSSASVSIASATGSAATAIPRTTAVGSSGCSQKGKAGC